MDIKSKEERSKNMSSIKNKNTKPEIMLRKALFNKGLRYRINYSLTGRPDIVFPSKRLAVFVDGCFWHGCPTCYRAPDTNKEFWNRKLIRNKKRDQDVNLLLTKQGWRIMRFWEHQIKKDLENVVNNIIEELGNGNLLDFR